jgi:transcriptional regulator with XRE-family HTH domain
MRILAAQLHNARTRLGWSIAELAKRTDLQAVRIDGLERGRPMTPSEQSAILRAFQEAGVSLLGRDEARLWGTAK